MSPATNSGATPPASSDEHGSLDEHGALREHSDLREHSEPALVPVPTGRNLTDALVAAATDDPTRVMLSKRRGAAWIDVCAADFVAEVEALAKGIIAAGVQPGDRVALMSRTRYEWTLADYAIWFAGAVTVPVYETSSAEQLEWILTDSQAVAVILEGAAHQGVFDQIAVAVPELIRVWVIDNGDLGALSRSGTDVSDDDLDARRTAVGPQDLATIIYTSGTTGRPKGCELTHGSFVYVVENTVAALPELFGAPNASTLLFLPLAHVFGRIIQIGAVQGRIRLGHTANIADLLPDLASFQPTFLLAVPRVFEKVFNGAQQKAISAGKGTIFQTAADTAVAYSEALDTGSPGLALRLKHAIFDRLVYRKLRDALGGDVAWAVSGGAPLGARLGHFFRGVGVTILEGYGLTETSAATTVNRPTSLRVGSVGRPLPGATIRIAQDGEVLIAGPHLFRGYWRNEQATAEALIDGWFHSGDIGALDDEGFLAITGRKKELIVTSGGKNVAPAVIEDRLRSNWLISQCVVVGDSRPFIGALITIDSESLPTWLTSRGRAATISVAELVEDHELVAEIQTAVDEANKAVSQAEGVRRFLIVGQDWTEAGGQLTPSLKLKRSVVMAEQSAAIEALYA